MLTIDHAVAVCRVCIVRELKAALAERTSIIMNNGLDERLIFGDRTRKLIHEVEHGLTVESEIPGDCIRDRIIGICQSFRLSHDDTDTVVARLMQEEKK